MNKFEQDLKRADSFEKGLIEYAKHDKNILDVLDVRHDSLFQDKDIDFVLLTVKHEIINIEAKIDFFSTNNFFFEVKSNKMYNTKGCMLKTESDYIWYYYINQSKLYVIPTIALKQFIKDYNGDYTNGGDNALGIKIKRGDLHRKVKYNKYDVCV